MKIIDDSKLFFYGGIITLIITISLGLVSFYSILSVEPEVRSLIESKENMNSNFKKAYLILREPQIFGGYENFDAEGYSIKNTLIFFDSMLYSKSDILPGQKKYLEVLLKRRSQGSLLGRNSMFFTLIITIMLWVSFFVEKRQVSSKK